jgi:soluble P-type ATPase
MQNKKKTFYKIKKQKYYGEKYEMMMIGDGLNDILSL